MSEAVIQLGANLGDRIGNIKRTIVALDRLPKTKVVAVSHLYETKPIDVPDKQIDYVNCCVKLETSLFPLTLLGACLALEAQAGRIRDFPHSSRIIDVDLILYDDLHIVTKDLILPHPRALERAFVLIPLADLYHDRKTPSFEFSRSLEKVIEGQTTRVMESRFLWC